MPAKLSLSSGQVFNRWTLVRKSSDHTKPYWHVICQCGKEKVVEQSSIVGGYSRSCGCLLAEANVARTIPNNHKNTYLYRTWRAMHRRCENPASSNYKDYGARGITVCAEWSDYEVFRRDVGERPTDKHTLDRVENSGSYTLDNIRWATAIEQGANKRNNVRHELNGELKTVRELAELAGISYQAMYLRLSRGSSASEAVSTAPYARA